MSDSERSGDSEEEGEGGSSTHGALHDTLQGFGGAIQGFVNWFTAEAPPTPPSHTRESVETSRWFWRQREPELTPSKAPQGFLRIPPSLLSDSATGSTSSLRSGWSREHSRRLSRLQAIARGWIVRRRVTWFPAAQVDAQIRDLEQKDRGLCALLWYIIFLALFFMAVADNTSYKRAVEAGLSNWIAQITYGESSKTFDQMTSLDDLKLFSKALLVWAYDGNQREHPCNACDVLERDFIKHLYDESTQTLATVYQDENNRTYNASVVNCPLCWNTTSNAKVDSTPAGSLFCYFCYAGKSCLDGTCDGFDPASAEAEVHGYNASEIKVNSLEDCYAASYYTTVGYTKDLAAALISADFTLNSTGRGYIAEKNRVIGGMLVGWNLRAETECLDQDMAGYYGPCFSTKEHVRDVMQLDSNFSFNSTLAYIPASGGYITPFDVGGYNVGLNFGLCAMMELVESTIALPRNVRGFDVVLNLYNGNNDAMFAGLLLSVDFLLGGRVSVSQTITPFRLVTYSWPPANAFWDVVKGLALVLLAWFVVVDVWRIVHHVSSAWRLPKSARGARTGNFQSRHLIFSRSLSGWDLVVLISDFSFVMVAVLSIWFACKAQNFVVSPNIQGQSSQLANPIFGTAEDLVWFGQLKDTQMLALVSASVFSLLRLFYLARFHRRLSVVTDTIGRGMVHLAHFFIVYFINALFYTVIMFVLFGPKDPRFGTFLDAFVAVTRIGLGGEFQNYYPDMLVELPKLGAVIIFTYQVLVAVLLLNILIAILLDAYSAVSKEGNAAETDTLWESIQTTICRTGLKITRRFNAAAKMQQERLAKFTRRRHRAALGKPSGRSSGRVSGGGAVSDVSDADDDLRKRRGLSQPLGSFEPALAVPGAQSGEDEKEAFPEDAADPQSLAHQRRFSVPGEARRGAAAAAAQRNWRTVGGGQPSSGEGQGGARKRASLLRAPGAKRKSLHEALAERRTRGKRRRVEYFSLKAAAEMFRASPLPEFAVRRKLRQLIHMQLRLRAGAPYFGGKAQAGK